MNYDIETGYALLKVYSFVEESIALRYRSIDRLMRKSYFIKANDLFKTLENYYRDIRLLENFKEIADKFYNKLTETEKALYDYKYKNTRNKSILSERTKN